jgi:hypothetical protein
VTGVYLGLFPRLMDSASRLRSGILLGQRREACSALDHTARIPTSALYPAIRYRRFTSYLCKTDLICSDG